MLIKLIRPTKPEALLWKAIVAANTAKESIRAPRSSKALSYSPLSKLRMLSLLPLIRTSPTRSTSDITVLIAP